MRKRLVAASVLASILATVAADAGPLSAHHLVACAPGYPGSTEQAQPTMDDFAAMVSAASGWEPGTLSAEYRPDEDEGVARLRDEATTLGLVPLPFFLKHEHELGLVPIAQAVLGSGAATERWSLAAPAGRVAAPGDLDGYEVVGIPAYSPRFVRGPLLGGWGELPADVTLAFTGRVLGALRRIDAGEDVAVLLDGPQAEALAALPFAAAIEVVAQSPPLISALIVGVGGRAAEVDLDALTAGLLRVHENEQFADVLDTLRLVGFEALDHEALQAARAAFEKAGAASASAG